jgi:hypothetical protein
MAYTFDHPSEEAVTRDTIHDDDLIAKIMAYQNPGLPDEKQELLLQHHIATASV